MFNRYHTILKREQQAYDVKYIRLELIGCLELIDKLKNFDNDKEFFL